MSDISVEELDRWRRIGRNFQLLDVREPFELSVAALPNALHIPLRDIPARLHELDPQAEIIVFCHYGVRSETAAQFLRNSGFTRVNNLQGGIDAYAERIEPAIARY